MKTKLFFAPVMAILLSANLAFAGEGQLMLDKLRLPFNISLGDSACDELMYIDSGKDIADMRSFPCYSRSGRYTAALNGPPGATVTLFGYFSYGKERGYLIIKKKDARQVWILNLENFPHDQWVTIEAQRQSGAYEAYYHPAPIFEQNVSSIKWGIWWPAGGPANGS